MKKKLIAIFLCVALVAVGVVGATIAYFTDDDKVENNFTIGDVKIDLTETAGVKDGDGKDVDGCVKANDDGGYTYSNLMAGYEIEKKADITNTGYQPAYVRVAVVINNHKARNEAIDEAYEAKGQEFVQGKYNEIFDGWYINNTAEKDNLGYTNKIRNSMAQRTSVEAGVDIINIDSVRCPYVGAGYQWEHWNLFQTDTEKANTSLNMAMNGGGYYQDALDVDSNLYVFYLKLAPGKSYTLFDGLNVPAEFTQEQAKMFDGLTIGIYADAIQTAGFNDTVDETSGAVTEAAYVKAFNALEAAHSLGWWN